MYFVNYIFFIPVTNCCGINYNSENVQRNVTARSNLALRRCPHAPSFHRPYKVLCKISSQFSISHFIFSVV